MTPSHPEKPHHETASIPSKVQHLEYPSLGDSPELPSSSAPLTLEISGEALDPLLHVPLEVRVLLGTAFPTLADLARLTTGSVVVLDTVAGDPVVLEVAGVPFARAEVVVLDDQYAVRIVELLDDPAALVDGQATASRPVAP